MNGLCIKRELDLIFDVCVFCKSMNVLKAGGVLSPLSKCLSLWCYSKAKKRIFLLSILFTIILFLKSSHTIFFFACGGRQNGRCSVYIY